MKSRIKRLEGTARQLEIEASKERVDEVFAQVLEDIGRRAKIPGFRPGKVPLDIIRKNYSEDALDEVKRRLIPKAYQEALEEHNINPVSYPEVLDVNIAQSGCLTFKAKVDIYPDITLRNYKKLKVTTDKVVVLDKEVEDALTRIRNMQAEFIDMDGPLKKGDFAVCDVETFMDGRAISQKRDNMWIEVSKEASMFGMGEELCGLKKGDKKDIETLLPEGYPDEKYAGRKAVFRVQIKETKEKKLPELDEALAEKVGKKSIDDVRREIRSQLMEKKEANAKITMKNQILEQLLKKHSIDLPPSMVKRQLKVLMERAQAELAKKGVGKEAIESHKDKLKDQIQKEAEDKVRAYFLLDKIANVENIDVSDEEVDMWLKSLAESYNQSFEKVRKYYKDRDLLGGLKEQLREEKTLDFLLSEAVITKKK